MSQDKLSPLAATLIERFGRPILSLVEAGQQIGFKSPGAIYVARHKGKFPLQVIDSGGALMVSVVEVARFVETGRPAHAALSVTPVRRGKGGGRPTKAEQIRRRELAALAGEVQS